MKIYVVGIMPYDISLFQKKKISIFGDSIKTISDNIIKEILKSEGVLNIG